MGSWWDLLGGGFLTVLARLALRMMTGSLAS